jgi:hypothetical protein
VGRPHYFNEVERLFPRQNEVNDLEEFVELCKMLDCLEGTRVVLPNLNLPLLPNGEYSKRN